MNRLLSPQPVVYRGTVTGLRISAVDGGATESGGAFVDGLPSAVIDLVATYPGDLSFEAFDPAGRFIRGVLKAVGTVEGLYAELLPHNHFDSADFSSGVPIGWIKPRGAASVDTTNMIEGDACGQILNPTGNNGIIQISLASTVGSLLKLSFYIKTAAGAGGYFRDAQGIQTQLLTNSTAAWVNTTLYFTDSDGPFIPAFNATINAVAGTNGLWYDYSSLKQVLTPSSSGAVITSLKNGTVFNWAYKNASFVFNAVSYYCVVRRLR